MPESSLKNVPLNHEILVNFYEKMFFIRSFEENLLQLFDQGLLFGTTHTSIGQEALPVALSHLLLKSDIVFSSHRCHGHYIAHTDDAESLLKEIMGRKGGICEGYGGSQHIYRTNFYSNGIQGGYMPIIAGVSYSEKIKKNDSVTTGFIGDGTLGEGAVYEALNLISLMQCPCLIIIEHNHYAQSTPTDNTISGSIIDRVKAFGINCSELESNDIEKLYSALSPIVSNVRKTQTPYVFVHHTYRLGPHSKGDDNRDKKEIEKWKAKDPLLLLENKLNPDTVATIQNQCSTRLKAIVEKAGKAEFAQLNIEEKSKDSLWKHDMFSL